MNQEFSAGQSKLSDAGQLKSSDLRDEYIYINKNKYDIRDINDEFLTVWDRNTKKTMQVRKTSVFATQVLQFKPDSKRFKLLHE